ncbi:DNA repair protein rad16 [Protomyces lactucae-debilis]|uniref:DNA repair protein rad16 n=1 Tax=Protomyces lactucae-debilis TaxID=2754530 RepID=A0A1Y2F8N0_PROLT|nr:DNA repair protein rad16 [Protomyces lactucae-debilis]ORY79814.1 DNA repair protein rad16 [Protomyces lactucae-debilis]
MTEQAPLELDAPLPKHIDLPLRYQQRCFQDIYAEDGLIIVARGLGLLSIVANLLFALDVPGSLTLLVNAEAHQQDWLGEFLVERQAVTGQGAGMTKITSESTGVDARAKAYARGGVLAVTSRILIVDLLSRNLNPATVSGVVVLHAETVRSTSIESFILRVIRSDNKDAPIKAFSDQPEAFTGFAPLANMLKSLFVPRVFLWPRFHLDVAESLDSRKADVVELEVAMTPAMRDIQNAIMESMAAVMKEVRNANSQHLDLEEWNTEHALHKQFDAVIRRQLAPVWHRVSWRSKDLIADIGTLRHLLHQLLTYDCVTFNKEIDVLYIHNSTERNAKFQSYDPWLMQDVAQPIFQLARERVYRSKSGAHTPVGVLPADLEPVLEEQPKWEQLTEVLDEIHRESQFEEHVDLSNSTILIMCNDYKTCRTLKDFLETEDHSGRIFLDRKLNSYRHWKRTYKPIATELAERQEEPKRTTVYKGPLNKRRRVRGGGNSSGRTELQATQQSNQDLLEPLAEAPDELADMEDCYGLVDQDDLVVILPYSGDLDDRVLEELQPKFVIMYELDPAFVRRIEVFRTLHRELNLRAYFMFYGGSVEEQRYLSSVRREKDAFSRLIRERATMTRNLTQEVRPGDDEQELFFRKVNTRVAGGGGRLAATREQPRIIVDVREFRSSLPGLLHVRGNFLQPCFLLVGDYVISPDMCVERKSISDLIGSFANGRLFQQCEQMLQHYKTPLVLIEFDEDKATRFTPFGNDKGGDIADVDLQTKLVMLNLAFPAIKFIWSSSPLVTAEIFEELKRTHSEPDAREAVSKGSGEQGDTVLNQKAIDLLEALPGISGKNAPNIYRQCENISELVNLEERDMIRMVGPETGRRLHRFINKELG